MLFLHVSYAAVFRATCTIKMTFKVFQCYDHFGIKKKKVLTWEIFKYFYCNCNRAGSTVLDNFLDGKNLVLLFKNLEILSL